MWQIDSSVLVTLVDVRLPGETVHDTHTLDVQDDR